jgi:repressor LexA
MRRSEELTVRQGQIAKYYKDRQRQTGIFPTLQEAADHFGFKSRNAVRQHLRLIEKKGAVHRVFGHSRSLEFLRPDKRSAPDSVRVPLIGTIPAGNLATTYEDAEELLNLPANYFRGHQLFALHVRGTSMEGAGILHGDVAVLDETPAVTEGAIAALLIEDEATLKRVYHTREALVLKAENQAFPDIEISVTEAQQPRVLGVLVGILRRI